MTSNLISIMFFMVFVVCAVTSMFGVRFLISRSRKATFYICGLASGLIAVIYWYSAKLYADVGLMSFFLCLFFALQEKSWRNK
jgi:hypothetical protein